MAGFSLESGVYLGCSAEIWYLEASRCSVAAKAVVLVPGERQCNECKVTIDQ